MAITGVELQINRQIIRFAEIKEHQSGATEALGGDDFWDLVDAASDETYENRVKGLDMTNLDFALNSANIGIHARQWMSLHDQYANRDLGNTGGLVSLIQDYNWRAPEKFAKVHREALSRDMAATSVSADEETQIAYIELDAFGDVVITNPDYSIAPLDSALFSDTPLRLIKRGGIQGPSGVTVDLQLRTFLNETTPLTVSIAIPAAAPNDTALSAIVGQTTPDDLAVGAVKIVPGLSQATLLARGFVDGGWILINETLSGQITPQFIKLKPDADEGVTVTGELHFDDGYAVRHNYTTAARVYPCFSEVVTASHTGNEGTEFSIQPRNDFPVTPF